MINDAARFISTVYNYKGMKPLNDEEIKRRSQETQRRKELVDSVNKRFSDLEIGDTPLKDKSLVLTPEERKNMQDKDLVEELNRMKMGIKDDHDFKVEEYEKAMKRIYLEDKKRKENLIVERIRNNPDPYVMPIVAKSRVIEDEEDLDNDRD